MSNEQGRNLYDNEIRMSPERYDAPVYETDSDEFQSNSSDSESNSSTRSILEEDNDDFDSISANNDSLNMNDINNDNFMSKCLNESPITLSEYDNSDYSELFIIYLLNNSGKFEKGSCLRKDELIELLKSDIIKDDAKPPNNIMSIYTTPVSKYKHDFLTGLTGKPTAKLVVRIPSNNIYVTYGSITNILNSKNKEWFALPLYGGNRRRVGNIMGIYGSSMNHGQAPGFIIYKLLSKQEVENNKLINETRDDYPQIYLVDSMKPLHDILNEMMIPMKIFINKMINDLIKIKNTSVNKILRLAHKNKKTSTSNDVDWDFDI